MTVRRPSHEFAAQLRRNQTDVEPRLWQTLRDRKMAGAKFRRQVPIGPYVVDFLCLGKRLIIELDGGQHAEEDDTRQRWLQAQGYRVLRFWNNDLTTNFAGALSRIASVVE